MRLYKFRSLDNIEFVLDILLNERLYCATYESLNDPLEGLFYTIINPLGTSIKKRRYSTIEQLPTYNSDLRVCSLSESFDDIRMWSHYASGHTGVAIEIEFDGITEDLVPVSYESGLQEHGTTILAGSSATDVLSFKTDHWNYEKEIRLLQKSEYYPIKGRVSRVYFGVRTSDFHKELLIKSAPKTIEFLDTRLDRKNVVVRSMNS